MVNGQEERRETPDRLHSGEGANFTMIGRQSKMPRDRHRTST
jgi:hypothetical protein